MRSVLIGISTVACALATGDSAQTLLGNTKSASDFTCDLSPSIDPKGDGLPSSSDLFSSHDALKLHIKRHQAIVRVPSVCYDDMGSFDEDERWIPFYHLHDVLRETYPLVHKHAELIKVNTLSLVYTIKGSDSSLKPIMLAAHQDVVPVEDESKWTYPPFDAVLDGDWLWGRGTVDDKSCMTGMMTAVETLLSLNWKPTRTIILAFGSDEECSGYRGAHYIGKHLTDIYGDDGIELVVDEGGLGQFQVDNVLYHLVGVNEKGFMNVWFEVHVIGGHSSLPFPHTGIGIMSQIINTLESNPFEPKLTKDSPAYNTLVCQARHSPKAAPEINHLLEKGDLDGITSLLASLNPVTQYMIQTSQATNIIRGGEKINAMPEVVTVGMNLRVAPHDSTGSVKARIVDLLSDIVSRFNLTLKDFEGDRDYKEYRAEHPPKHHWVRPLYEVDYNGTLILYANKTFEASPISPTRGRTWDLLSGTIQHSFTFDGGKGVPVGTAMTANTDMRHYLNLTPYIYRWTPAPQDTIPNIHTFDERIRVDALLNMTKFYYDLVRNFDIVTF